MDNRKSYVYKIKCKITGEYYFGSSFRAKSDRSWGGGRKIRERIAQYGKENFVKEILEEFDDRVEANKKENQYIEQFINDEKCLNQMLNRHFGSYNDETCAKRSAAERGKHVSAETRAKISAARRGEKSPMYGKHHTEETRAKISDALRGDKNPMYGKHHTEETRSKMSDAKRGEKSPWYGKHFSEEHKAKMSAALRGKTFSEEHRAKLSAALRGKPQQHSKHWRKNPVTGKREWYD